MKLPRIPSQDVPPRKVLIVSFSETASDPRVKRQAAALREHFDVSIAGFGAAGGTGDKFFSLKGVRANKRKSVHRAIEVLELTLCYLKLYRLNYWWMKPPVRSLAALLKKESFDVVLANEPETIPVTVAKAARDTVIVHDQHEYWPDLFISQIKRRVISGYRTWLISKYARHLEHWSVVGARIGLEYQLHAGLPAPVVISNAAKFQDLEPSPVHPNRIDLIHHGLWDPGRGVEKIITALGQTDGRFHLHLMLINSPAEKLQDLARHVGVVDRVHFHRPVHQDHVPAFINQFDMEVIFIQPVNKNFELALPNKLFEAIQGRLAIISAPLPEIEEIVRSEAIGVISESFEANSLADALRPLSPEDVKRMKERTMHAAQKYNAEENSERLVTLIWEALGKKIKAKEV